MRSTVLNTTARRQSDIVLIVQKKTAAVNLRAAKFRKIYGRRKPLKFQHFIKLFHVKLQIVIALFSDL